MNLFIGVMIPFLGTTLGAAMVFFMKDQLNHRLEKFLLGFAAGIMIAASIWSLLIPAMEHSVSQGESEWFSAAFGFSLGILFLFLLDILIPHLHLHDDEPEGIQKQGLSKTIMFFFAVTLHNIPEGMAVGVVLAGMLQGNAMISLSSAIALSIGIAIQNFPEGAILSLPLKASGYSKSKSFVFGMLSGIVEPLAALITLLFSQFVIHYLSYFLAFAAGAMMYVVIEELIPESQNGKHSNLGTIGAAIGFVLMMVLDVMLG